MAENRETTIIDVKLDAGKVAQDLNDVITRIAALKTQQSELTKEIKAGNDTNGEMAKKLIAVKDALSWNEKQAKALTATTKLLTADSATYADTLNGQRQKLADLQKAYGELTAEQRNTEGGKAFLESIHAQSDAVKELEAAMGDNRRNVGNYPQAWNAVIPSMNKANSVMSAMGTSMDEFGSKGIKAFANMGTSIKAFGKTLLTSPVGWFAAAIAAIVAVFDKLREAFGKNDDAMTKLQKAFAAFQPIINLVNKLFEKLANFIADTIYGILDAIIDAINVVLRGASKVAGWFGIDADFTISYNKQRAAAEALVVAIDELQEKEREYTIETAKRAKEVSELRAKSIDAKDVNERIRLLGQAVELEKQDLEDRKKIAADKLRILEETAKQEADTSDETKDAIAKARADLYNVEREYYDGTRRLMKELQSAKNEAAKEEQKRRDDEIKRLQEQAKAEQDVRRMAEDFAVSQIADAGDREYAQRKLQGEREISALAERLANDKTLTAQAKDELNALILQKQQSLDDELAQMAETNDLERADQERERQMYIADQRQQVVEQMRQETDEEQRAYEEARWEAQKEVWQLQMEAELANIDLTEEQKLALQQKWNAVLESADRQHNDALVAIEKKSLDTRRRNQEATAQAIANLMGTMSSALAQFGEENKAAAIASKIVALGQIAVETGIATAKGIAQAQSVPFPANIGAIATTIASIMAGITSAISSVKSAKFSTGGVVGGGSYSQGDIVPAMLSPQEVVLNPSQTAQTLFAIANGGVAGNMQNLADNIAAAVSQLPAPVMDYQEFTQFEGRVANYNEFARI